MSFSRLFPDGCFPAEAGGSRVLAAQARDLLQKMLEQDPNKRINIDDALRHPYTNIWYKSAINKE
jgi:c-Jun N-terminal kinase